MNAGTGFFRFRLVRREGSKYGRIGLRSNRDWGDVCYRENWRATSNAIILHVAIRTISVLVQSRITATIV